MASIRKRGDLQWEASIRKRGYPPQSKTFNTSSEAKAWAATIESEMVRGVFVSRSEAEKTILEDLIHRYVAEVCPTHKGNYTESMNFKQIARWPVAQRIVSTLSPQDFSRLRDQRLKTRKPATVRTELALIRTLFNHAKREWGIHIENPLNWVKTPSVNNARSRRLSLAEEGKLMIEMGKSVRNADGTLAPGGVRNIWLKPIVLFALETAMRRGEILALTWSNVDLVKRVALLQDTKNGDSRAVPLTSAAVAILASLPRSIDGRVFPTTAEAVKQSFVRCCERCGLVDLHFHDLRHEATTRLARKLPNIIELARVTGHRDVNMLRRYYNITAEELAQKLG